MLKSKKHQKESKVAKEVLVGVKLFVCKKCPALAGRDFYVAIMRTRCCLCGRLMDPFDPESLAVSDAKSNYPKGVQRFPRELASTPEQKHVVELIQNRTKDFDCPGKVTNINVGPIVTEYEFAPDKFTRLKHVMGINEDLAIALEAENITIRRLHGKAAMSVDVPNKVRQEILFNDCLKNVIAHRDDMELPINFGVQANGQAYVEDLAQMPHLLIAGATGSGKSVFLNNVIASLLAIRTTNQLRFVMVDPKSVELFHYKGLPHLMQEPVAGVYEALNILEKLIQETKRRTSNLFAMKVKNLKEYNDKCKRGDLSPLTGNPLTKQDQWPYIVVVIDEMADLILTEKKSFSDKMAQLAAMSRAAGIHVIAATQRPSVDVLSGRIKVNFPARVAFGVPSQADSKTILNTKGAEQLLGKGDMLFMSPIRPGLQRLHAPNCKQPDVDRILKLSLEVGHVLAVPADMLTPEGLEKVVETSPKAMVN
jgi:DNA segregation ATPase FtsK/SpoIIIE, S-DNA-T family